MLSDLISWREIIGLPQEEGRYIVKTIDKKGKQILTTALYSNGQFWCPGVVIAWAYDLKPFEKRNNDG